MKSLRRNILAITSALFALFSLLGLSSFLCPLPSEAAIYGGTTVSVNATTGTTFASAATLGATNGVSARGQILSVSIANYLTDGTAATDAVKVVFQTYQGLTVYSNTVTGSANAYPRATVTDTAGSTISTSGTNFVLNTTGIPFDGLNASVYLATRTGLVTKIKFTYSDSL